MRRLFTALLCLAAAAAAQSSDQAYPLRDVRIVGNEILPTEKVVAATGLEIGAAVTESDFQDGLQKLNNSGLFELIEYSFGPIRIG